MLATKLLPIHRRHSSSGALALLGLMLSASSALAGDVFVDPGVYGRHAKASPPPVITAPDMMLAAPDFQFRRGNVEKTKGVAETVATAKRSVKMATGYDGTADIHTYAILGAVKTPQFMMLGAGRYDTAGTFDDANGAETHFGYNRDTEQVVLGYTPDAETSVRLVGLHDDIQDEKNPHYSLDLKTSDRKVSKLMVAKKNLFGEGTVFDLDLGVMDFNRRADNYSLRGNSSTKLRVAVDKTAFNGAAKAGFTAGGFENMLTLSGEYSNHKARRYNVSNGDAVNAERLPDIDRTEAGLSFDSKTMLTEGGEFSGGLRYDIVHSSPNRAYSTVSGGPAGLHNVNPATLYSTYYGVTELEATDHNVSGRLRYEQALAGSGTSLYGDLSYITRSGDNLEKYHGVSGPYANRWIGNPQIDPEKHAKTEIGFTHEGDGYLGYGRKKPGSGLGESVRIAGKLYYDKVYDFISLDRALGQDGVLESDRAIIYRNVDATFFGAEADFQWNVTRKWATRLNLAYTWAENDTDNRAVYQIAPFEANLLVDYTDRLGTIGTWNIGSRLRLVADQNRLDDDSSQAIGFDESTGGFGVLDLYSGVQLHDRIALTLSVDNVFDKSYREFLKGDHVEDPTKSTVYMPGRTAYLRLVGNF